MNKKLKLGLFLFLIGFVGVLTTLTMQIPLPEDVQKMIGELFSPWQFKLLSLINPTILLIVAIVMGTMVYDKVNLKLPLIESLVFNSTSVNLPSILKFGVIGGSVAGILITISAIVFEPILPPEFVAIGAKFKPGLAVRLLYGGLTEEILIRFGLMSILVWLIFKISGKMNRMVYWTGILISAILFGFGHLPLVYTLIGKPTAELLFYIIFGNAIGGIIFGWLYWKKGLEAAMIGHMLAHMVMLAGEHIFDI